MEFVPADTARSTLPELLERATYRHETFVITRRGKPMAQLAPTETHYLLVDDTEGNVVAVGPFTDTDAARDWEDAHEGSIGIVRGVVRTQHPDAYLTDKEA